MFRLFFGKVSYFCNADNKRYGFVVTEDSVEVFFHINNFTDLEINEDGVCFNPDLMASTRPRIPKIGDEICFALGDAPQKPGQRPSAYAWNWAQNYRTLERKIGIYLQHERVMVNFAGIENMAGICARCGKKVGVRTSPRIDWLYLDRFAPTDEQLFELDRHDMVPHRTCYASAAVPKKLVLKTGRMRATLIKHLEKDRLPRESAIYLIRFENGDVHDLGWDLDSRYGPDQMVNFLINHTFELEGTKHCWRQIGEDETYIKNELEIIITDVEAEMIRRQTNLFVGKV